MNFGKKLSYEQTDNRLRIHFENQDVILEFIRDDIVRVLVPFWMEDYRSQAIEGDKSVPVDYSVEEFQNVVIIRTDRLTIKIEDEFYMEVYDEKNHLLMADYRGDRMEKEAMDQQMIDLLAAEGHDVSKINQNSYAVQTVKALDPEDCFYGLGDKSGFLNKRHYEIRYFRQ